MRHITACRIACITLVAAIGCSDSDPGTEPNGGTGGGGGETPAGSGGGATSSTSGTGTGGEGGSSSSSSSSSSGGGDGGAGGSAPGCGNGTVDAGEACDDGNIDNTDACTNACENAACGDGFVQPGEACDDGNADDSDGCTSTCQNATCGDGFVQPGEECDDGNTENTDACTTGCLNAACGDGFVQPGEACDDANTDNTDACTSACQSAACGDGFVQAGEACDDANTDNTDACTSACQGAACGDGFVQAGEACDDGNTDNTDACTSACQSATCGDGFVQPGEACDDANTNDADFCSNACTSTCAGPGYLLDAATGHCYFVSTATATILGAETGCQALGPGYDVAALSTTAENTFVSTLVGTPTVWIGGDDRYTENTFVWGNGEPWTYTNSTPPWNGGEPNNSGGSEDCVERNGSGGFNDNWCGNPIPYLCERPGPSEAFCRDGVVQPGEQCDDGNVDNTDGCTNRCRLQPESVCNDGLDDDQDGSIDCADPDCALGCAMTATAACGAGEVLRVFTRLDNSRLRNPVTSTITVGATGTVGRVAVQLDLSHSWDGDVGAALGSPAGVSRTLVNGIGGDTDNFYGTIFDDACTNPIGGGSGPFSGCYRPDQPLSGFAGTAINGTWTLALSDSFPAFDDGGMHAWRLAFCALP